MGLHTYTMLALKAEDCELKASQASDFQALWN